MKKTLLTLGCAFSLASIAYSQDCSKIFISEYVEGFSNNKAIEIYNPTDQTVDMSQYFLQRYSNGSTTASAQGPANSDGKSIQLVGTVAAKSTIIYVIDQRDPSGTGMDAPVWDELQAKADYFLCPVYEDNNVMYFNGNDALLLCKGDATNPNTPATEIFDLFGKIGENPENGTLGTNGWSTVAPYNMTSGDPNDRVVTEDHSMIRKQTVKIGNIPSGSPVGITFNPLQDWDSIPASLPKIDSVTGDTVYQADGVTPQWVGNWESLGWHACECDPNSLGVEKMDLSQIKLYPNPSEGNFTLTGLNNVERIEVVNSLGQVVKTIKGNELTTININLTNKAGVYFVTITDKTGATATQKVIIR